MTTPVARVSQSPKADAFGVNPYFETVFAATLPSGIDGLRSSVQIKPAQRKCLLFIHRRSS